MTDTKDLKVDLALAVKKLELFSEESFDDKMSPMQRTMDLARTLISTTFSEKKRNKKKSERVFLESEVLNAIQTIQKNYLFIQKLKKGCEAEQALADSAVKVVERYNETVKKSAERNSRLNWRISNYIYKQCGLSGDQLTKEIVHLPLEAYVEFNQGLKINQTANSTIGNESISQIEADAFRMKAISLLPAQEIRFTSAREEFQTIRSTPIQAVTDSVDLKRVLMSQVLKPFPGETIAVKGEFQRNAHALHKSVPLSDSFEILAHSKQTGFPHPIQHTGWALSDCMIPLYPLKMDLLKNFKPLFQAKQKMALELLPKGHLILKAKDILKVKKQAAEKNKNEILAGHLELNLSILKNEQEIVRNYFQHVEKISNSFDYLAETEEIILNSFIVKPFEKLKEECIPGKTKYFEALAILETYQKDALDELKDDVRSDFIRLKGEVIGQAANAIVLQHLSETIGFHPPKLSLFEQKVQIALYKQLLAFRVELSEKNWNAESIFQHVMNELNSDITLFKAQTEDELTGLPKMIVDELATYYQSQFYTN